ncbi:helix-turn-helix domain-containing protein [Nonomuraea helvata]|uniref:Helix-turn-helix domain-containing protein n=1 Tax=Nonomuraea helvata TaxID=37484 RepID=A0ABV5S5X4_9ACTN
MAVWAAHVAGRDRRIGPNLRPDLGNASRYQAGEPSCTLALSLGRSYGFVHQLLEEAGVELRHGGGDKRPKSATTEATTSTGAEQ